MFKYLALLLLLLAACDTYVEDKRSVDFEPIYLQDSQEEDKGSDLGTIYQQNKGNLFAMEARACLLYTSPSPRDKRQSRMPSSA